jgi:hypothetical protein
MGAWRPAYRYEGDPAAAAYMVPVFDQEACGRFGIVPAKSAALVGYAGEPPPVVPRR